MHPGHLYLSCRLGPSSRAGPPAALRKRRAQRAAGAETLGAGARKGSRPNWGSTQGQRRGPLHPAPKDCLDSKETAVLEEHLSTGLGASGLKVLSGS